MQEQSTLSTECSSCLWRNASPGKMDAEFTCLAFPTGIPAELISGRVSHEEPFTGDQGIRYREGNPSEPLS